MSDFKFDAIGTLWQIDFFSPVLDEKKSEILSCIQKRIDEFDKIYSRFRGDSLISQIATSKGEYVFPDDSKELFDLYYALYGETDGLFTPFVGQMLSDAGYDASYSLVQKKPLEIAPLWERVIEFDFPRLIVRELVLLDFGAAGKGYLVDIVSGIISSLMREETCSTSVRNQRWLHLRILRILLRRLEHFRYKIKACADPLATGVYGENLLTL